MINNDENILNFVLTLTTILISAIALWISIRNASKQNKIALFEHRYEIYRKITEIGDLKPGLEVNVLPPGFPNDRQVWNSFYISLLLSNEQSKVQNANDSVIRIMLLLKDNEEMLSRANLLFKMKKHEKKTFDDFVEAYNEFTRQLLIAEEDLDIKKKKLKTSFEKDYPVIIEMMRRQIKL